MPEKEVADTKVGNSTFYWSKEDQISWNVVEPPRTGSREARRNTLEVLQKETRRANIAKNTEE